MEKKNSLLLIQKQENEHTRVYVCVTLSCPVQQKRTQNYKATFLHLKNKFTKIIEEMLHDIDLGNKFWEHDTKITGDNNNKKTREITSS